jgi:hypothetical protein
MAQYMTLWHVSFNFVIDMNKRHPLGHRPCHSIHLSLCGKIFRNETVDEYIHINDICIFFVYFASVFVKLA